MLDAAQVHADLLRAEEARVAQAQAIEAALRADADAAREALGAAAGRAGAMFRAEGRLACE